MRTSIQIIILLFLLVPASGFTAEPVLDEANTFFSQALDTPDQQEAQALLDKALLRYEQLYRDQPGGRLAYNIGNTYYQMHNKPMALVFYKRALRSIPSDANLLHNLSLVREELQLESTAPASGLSWLPSSIRTNLLQVTLALYALFWLCATLRYIKPVTMPMVIPAILLILCLATSTVIGMDKLHPTQQEGVIINPDSIGRQGNGRNFEPSFNDPLPLGTEFILLEKRGYWLRIQLSQGDECWVPTRSCEII